MLHSCYTTFCVGGIFLLLALCLTTVLECPVIAAEPIDHVVQLSVTPQASPCQLTLHWLKKGSSSSYTIYRRMALTDAWKQLATCPDSTTSYTDSDVLINIHYEYKVAAFGANLTAYGYAYAGVEVPFVEQRGKLILLVDDTIALPLKEELSRLVQDLIGDGWIVLRHDVSRTATPAEIKAVIKSDYQADPEEVKSVFLFGHIPMYMSGDMAPDGHNKRPWPADVYYASMQGEWPATPPTSIPAPLQLQVGRVDMFNLPALAPPSEIDLLRRYLEKDHNYRFKTYNIQHKAIVVDQFGEFRGDAFAQNGWRNFAVFVGAENVSTANWTDPVTTPYLWGFACGGGSYTSCGSIINTGQMKSVDPAVFTFVFGSFFGQWDASDALLRAVIATPNYGLTCGWAGYPNWFVHHMALGETIGFSTMLTQNNTRTNYAPANRSVGGLHVSLMGDPTLRVSMLTPPGKLEAVRDAKRGIRLNWTASPDATLGYYLYRATQADGPYIRVRSTPIKGITFQDKTPIKGMNYYMVRAIALQQSLTGSYYDASQGVFASCDLAKKQ